MTFTRDDQRDKIRAQFIGAAYFLAVVLIPLTAVTLEMVWGLVQINPAVIIPLMVGSVATGVAIYWYWFEYRTIAQ